MISYIEAKTLKLYNIMHITQIRGLIKTKYGKK